MKEIEQLARAAIGVDANRGDVLAVENLSFQELPLETPPPPTKVERWRGLLLPWTWALRYLGVAALFLVVYLLILRPVKKQALAAFRQLPGKFHAPQPPLPGAAASGVAEAATAIALAEGQRATQLKKKLTEKVKAEPAVASRLVESWVREDQDL
jgi:flagellar M-ring protein FliF